jgi:formate hydrogenlyase transcriptional activator
MREALFQNDRSARVQALFEQLFESSPDAILVAAADGQIRESNLQAERLFGYSRSELTGKTIEHLIPERFRKHHAQYRHDYQTNPQVRPMGTGLELFGKRRDGSEFPVDIMLSPVQTEGGPVVLAVVRDITDRKQTQEALRRSEERFRLLVDGARDYAIFMLDPSGNVASWNPGAERIKGYRADEIVGQHFSCFYSEEDIERGKPEYELQIAQTEGRYEEEGWRIRKDGSRFWANIIITALRNSTGDLIGFSKVTRDFTNRKKAEESLLHQLSKVVLANFASQQMLTVIADSVRHIVPFDYGTLALYDENAKRLRVQELSSYATNAKSILLTIEGTPDGWVFSNRHALFISQIEAFGFRPDGLAHFQSAGVRSGCWLPLSYEDRMIGTLFLGSKRESAFDSEDSDLLYQIANQIGAAVDHIYSRRHASELNEKLQKEKQYLEEELRTEYSFEEIIGESSGLKRVLKHVETVAPTDATVMILGDTGTGKELIARAIHNLSPRRDRTFVKLNCSAIPLGLLESELFGHEKGAFTGAIAQRVGRLELAHRGTLFLDEIGDLPLELQPKLLRALQEKEIERLGGRRTIPVDVRLIAATNRDLAKMVKEGQFRSDLYYRLRVFPIDIPPLQQRRGDIPMLVNYFVSKHARRMNKHIDTIPADVMAALTKWHWPGNVRELENFIERAVILTQGTSLRAPLAELEIAQEPESSTLSNLRITERDHILRVLREAKGAIGGPGGAAERLGLKRTTLNSKLKRLGIEREDYS